ncbi:MAG TPA: hypothetical protein VM012_08325 [Flavitalea sp.]|nr:hypothetical protein [Flavitalea sp.]
MRKYTIVFSFDGQRETADCTESKTSDGITYDVSPTNDILLQKFGKTTFRQKEAEFLSGEPITDLTYYSALKEGLENHLYDKKE